MKIAVVWYWDKASSVWENWRDGHRAAFEYLERDNEVCWFLDKGTPNPKSGWDAIVLWDDSNSEFLHKMKDYGECVKAICLTTSPHNPVNLRNADVVFCESTPVYEDTRRHGIRAIKAFGTDTTFFAPTGKKNKDIEFFYPATFSPWKRQSEIAYLGNRLYCVGTIQPDGYDELNACLNNGVRVEEGYFPAEKIRDLYDRTEKMLIPAVHGSERTVLEAMSMNILPVLTNKEANIKAQSYLDEYVSLGGNMSPRDFILSRYTAKHFAENIMKGLTND